MEHLPKLSHRRALDASFETKLSRMYMEKEVYLTLSRNFFQKLVPVALDKRADVG
jgi:hypothetical protein